MPIGLPLAQTGAGTRVLQGARCIFSYNGNVVAFATRLSGGEDIRMEPIKVLGRLATVEFVPTSYDVTFASGVFRTVARGQVSDSSFPGSLKQQALFPSLNQILKVEGADATIVDEATDKIIALLRGCKASGYDWDIPAVGVVLQNMRWVGVQWLDESEVTGTQITP